MGLGLPVIIDITISLVFTYFTLSLLASEVQELLKGLLQWRAVHLKESIEGLLVGNESAQLGEARELANQLYANPLIRSLSHQTKGGVADALRAPFRTVSKVIQADPKQRVFGGQDGGPSRLPATAFTGSLLSTFDVVGIYRYVVAYRLEVTLKEMIPSPEAYQTNLAPAVESILATFKAKQSSLAVTVKNLAEEAQADEDIFEPTLFQRSFGSPETITRFTRKMQLSLADIIRAVRRYLQLKEDNLIDLTRALKETPTFEQAKTALMTLRQENPELDAVLPPSTDQTFLALALILLNPELQKLIQKLPPLPPALGDNLEKLADAALEKIEDLAEETAQFEQEISTWFDRSMERAKGVYNRNSKVVALVIGLVVAILANADSFYMIDRFAKEKTLTASVISAVDQLPPDALGQTDRINELNAQLSLPIGWRTPTVENQVKFRVIPLSVLPFWAERVPGWIVTGIAVSMGASFWYKLLKKLVDVRNAGQTPQPVTTTAGPVATTSPSSPRA